MQLQEELSVQCTIKQTSGQKKYAFKGLNTLFLLPRSSSPLLPSSQLLLIALHQLTWFFTLGKNPCPPATTPGCISSWRVQEAQHSEQWKLVARGQKDELSAQSRLCLKTAASGDAEVKKLLSIMQETGCKI